MLKVIERSSEAYEAILKMKALIKQLAEGQKQTRIAKKQKSPYKALEITVLHRLYLQIRNKPFETVHSVRGKDEARWIEKRLVETFNLTEILG